eukprot:TRINITY_DN35239_c0_g1_i1.p1 TRINITY_DN35239_c0_g1~~TRINITY_DN35239_c0_g1_i1.p1  ORF type:complete len:164 (+),score=18.46 TRINITY_DN35239_c0_g1_i1:51-542(+)
MRGVVQRVTSAAVTVSGEEVASIGKGLCVLVGISNSSTKDMVPWMVKKILSLRVFENEEGKGWSKNVTEVGGSVLLVSQFTLCHVLKGNKPDFHNAMPGPESEPFFNELVQAMKLAYSPDKIQTGAFGAYMQVHIQNDGPVTLVLDAPETPDRNQRKPPKNAP